MTDWKLFLECSQGHRFGVEVVCPTCDEVVAKHLHHETAVEIDWDATGIRPAEKLTRRMKRRMRRDIRRMERGEL